MRNTRFIFVEGNYHYDIARAIRTICDERGSAWEAYQVNWKVASPYGMQRSLQGADNHE
ncbi:MAG: hypothetical protein ACYDER_12610 [Ktedonobacteraceae bacterium]